MQFLECPILKKRAVTFWKKFFISYMRSFQCKYCSSELRHNFIVRNLFSIILYFVILSILIIIFWWFFTGLGFSIFFLKWSSFFVVAYLSLRFLSVFFPLVPIEKKRKK